jgi:hypothetical protein
MSMIGKLRQVSEFDLARYKKNPADMVRALAGRTSSVADPRVYTEMKGALEQSPIVQKMREMQTQGKAPTREEQIELQKQMLQLLRGMKKDMIQPSASAPIPGDPQVSEIDLHKSWHCLHFLLTGKGQESDGSPLGNAILGGAEIGGEAADTGYGPPRALSPAQVRAVSAALAEFPIDHAAAAFDQQAAEKAGVYVPQHEEEELKEYFGQLRDFYHDAAKKGNAVIVWIE